MKDLQHSGQSWLAEQLNKHAALNVIYERDCEQVPVIATIGKSTYQQASGDGLLTLAQVRDYLIDTVLLVIGDQLVLPRSGDRIRETQGDKTLVYEVMSLGDQPAWRYSDVFHLKFRIHTKLIRTEES